MTLTTKKITSAICAAALALPLLGPSSAEAESRNWRFQTLWQPGTSTQLAFERFADNVNVMSGGDIDITVLPAGSVVGVTGTVDAINQRILDGHHSAVVYWSGLNPSFAVLGDLNGAFGSAYDAMEYYYEFGGLDLLREAYEPLGLYPIGVAWWGVESVPSTRPLNSTADLEGLKIRLPQGMSSSIFEGFGAVPVNLPGSEVFSALDNGTIDATDWGVLSMNDELGFHDEAKYVLYPGFHSVPVGDVSIRLEDWNSLSDEHKRILEVAVREFGRDMLQTLRKQNVEVASRLAEEGVTLIDWPAEERAKVRAAAQEVWKEFGSQDELAARAVESQINFLRLKGLIE